MREAPRRCDRLSVRMVATGRIGPKDPHPALRATFSREREKGRGDYAALASLAFSSAKAQSSHCVSATTSDVSTVAPHQMRRPGGASR